MNCSEKVEGSVEDIFSAFHDLGTKNEQDLYLQGLIDNHEVQRRRPRKEEGSRMNTKSFTYKIAINGDKVQVCRQTFIAVHGITVKRVKRLQQLSILGKSPKDLRGFNDKQNSLPGQTKTLIREHIESYEIKESKYANKTIRYLNEKLNVKIMHKMFKEKHPTIKCGLTYFRNYFNENYNLHFGRPQVDSCGTCEELKVKIQNPFLGETAKRVATAELIVHKRKAAKFYNQLKLEREDKKEKRNTQVLSLAMDFMQNIPLPTIPVQDTFYIRQLTVNVFSIHNIKTNKATIYLYHESQARKGPNEVCSFLKDYLEDIPNTFKELHIYTDNCSGQNKNHDLCRFLLSLTDMKKFDKIEHFFPIRGHSYLPCDRDFGLIKKKLRRVDRIYTVHEITEIVMTSSNNPEKFIVKEFQTEQVKDFKTWWQEYYKKTCVSEETRGSKAPKDAKVYFGISSLTHFSYDSSKRGILKARTFINGIVQHTFKLKQAGSSIPTLPTNPAYIDGKVSIKEAKINDLKKLLVYIPNEHLAFYEEICNWLIGENEDDEEGED